MTSVFISRLGWIGCALLAPAVVLVADTCARAQAAPRQSVVAAAAARGRAASIRYGCDACHAIGDDDNTRIKAAAPLDGIGERSLIAGSVPNTEDNLALWIRDPRHFKPRTAMPALDVPAGDARDIAIYLRSLK